MVDYMTGSKLAVNILDRDAHFNHKHHYVIGKICDLVDGFRLIPCLTSDYDLGAFLTDLLEDLVDSLLEEIGGVRAFGHLRLSVKKKSVKSFERKFGKLFALIYGLCEARIRARVTSRAILLNDDHERIVITIGSYGNYVLIIAAGLSFEPKLTA
jgi:hypothetical protein